ncbi:branched-chain amino acid ABC transporter permease [Granulicatella seriolae]|uniref:Branched-chain amino acid ABC transporter permease n=1 Tax=Granulicatella seriolae TaxID=2967226 RepID=A0ABT1WPT6_9LACT|nr:branched-chain amino acid ABC transporter permease [Granulicatella seriolae]
MQRFHKKNIAWALLAIVGYLVLYLLIQARVINAYYEITLVTIMINIIYAVGLNLILGVAGQFSLGHAGFIAIGAYGGAILGTMVPGMAGMYLGMLAGVAVSIIVALLVGIPTLRLKGDYLAIATLGVAEIIRVALINMQGITNGAAGINGIPLSTTWTIVYVFLVLTTILILNYAYSSAGRATYAVLQDEIAAESMGVNVTKYKIIAFILGAVTASIGGTLSATYIGVVTPSDFTFTKSIDILIIVVFGGIGSFTGSFVAAILLGLVNMILQPYGQIRMIIYAVALVLIMVFRPGGLLGTKEFRFGSLVEKFFKKKGKKEESA